MQVGSPNKAGANIQGAAPEISEGKLCGTMGHESHKLIGNVMGVSVVIVEYTLQSLETERGATQPIPTGLQEIRTTIMPAPVAPQDALPNTEQKGFKVLGKIQKTT